MRLLVVAAITVGLALAEQNVLPADASLADGVKVVHDDGVKVVRDDAWLERRRLYIQGTADWQPRHVHLALGR